MTPRKKFDLLLGNYYCMLISYDKMMQDLSDVDSETSRSSIETNKHRVANTDVDSLFALVRDDLIAGAEYQLDPVESDSLYEIYQDFHEEIKEIFQLSKREITNKAWYESLMQSLKRLPHEVKWEDLSDWMSEQLRQIDVFLVPEKFQVEEVEELHCLGYAQRFMKNLPLFDEEEERPVDWEKEYIRTLFQENNHQTIAVEKNKLQAGDFILYVTSEKYSDDVNKIDRSSISDNLSLLWKHIAIYIGKKDNVHYALSKFGYENRVYLHPIEHPYQRYQQVGEPRYYRYCEPLLTPVRCPSGKHVCTIHH